MSINDQANRKWRMVIVLLAVLMGLVPGIINAQAPNDVDGGGKTTIYVDDDVPAGGDGSPGRPVQTIQDGVDLLPPEGGTVAVHPGIYYGPILLDRPGIHLVGLSTPQFDEQGFLLGFENPVVVKINQRLSSSQDIIGIQANNVTVSRFLIDGNEGPDCNAFGDDCAFMPLLNAAIGVRPVVADDFFQGISITENEIIRVPDTGIWITQASALVARNRMVGNFFNEDAAGQPNGGYLGIQWSASGTSQLAQAEVRQNWIENKSNGIEILGAPWEDGINAEWGAGKIQVTITDNLLANNTAVFFTPGVSSGINFFVRGWFSNHSEQAKIIGEVGHNHFINNGLAGIVILPGILCTPEGGIPTTCPAYEDGLPQDAPRAIDIQLQENGYQKNGADGQTNVFFTFVGLGTSGIVPDFKLHLTDLDGAVSDEQVANADLGDPALNNRLIVVGP